MQMRSGMQSRVGLKPSAAPRLQRVHLAKQLHKMSATGTGAGAATEKAGFELPVCFISTEVSPWSKTGGLGDVVGGLPIEMVKRGHKVMTVAPRFDQYSDAWDTSITLNVDGQEVRYFHCVDKYGVNRVWVDHPWFLAKVWGKTGSKLYGADSGADYVDNHKRFSMFCKAAVEAARVLPFGPGEDCVFVANDWHSSVVPVLLKDVYQPRGEFTKSKVALCIHNIAFQGRMWEDCYKEMNLPESSFEKFKFSDGYPKVYNELTPLKEDEKGEPSGGPHSKINWLKAGILSADKVLTVSPNYAAEIGRDDSSGVELDTYIRQVGGAEGIVNGMDVEEWDPRIDKYLAVKYDKSSVHAGKAAAKEALQANVGLPVDPSAPVFAFIGRLEEQKGADILVEALPQIVKEAPNAQVIILGTGKAKFEREVRALDMTYPGKVKGVVQFSAPLAHLMTAGADFILVPSRFEPCGLIQLHAMQYGTVPIVASTGGLVDTVKEGKTGFHMGAMDPSDLLVEDAEAMASTVGRAAKVFSTPQYKEMVVNCISQDLSWSKPAIKWESILHELWKGVPSTKSASIVTPVEEPIPGPPGKAAVEKPLTRPPPPVIPMPPLGKTAPTPAAAGAPSTNGVPKPPTPAAAPAPKVATAAAPAPKVAPAAAPAPKVAAAGAPSSNGAPAAAAPPAPKTVAKTRAQQAAAPGRK